MREQPFYKLPRTVQERFLGALAGRLQPLPLFRQPFAEKKSYLWVGLAAGALLVLLILVGAGHGRLDSGLAYEGFFWLLVYMGLTFAAGFGIAQILAARQQQKLFPFPKGIYVFPSSVIDARSDKLKVYPTSELTGASGPEGPEATVRFTFDGGASFAFAGGDAANAERLLEAFHAGRRRIPDAIARQDTNTLAELDPLYEPRFSSPVGPAKALERQIPSATKYGWPTALAVALVAGPALWIVRNATSDDSMYAKAKAQNDPESYRAYLARGSRHAEEVRGVLLPRAELAVAVHAGTVRAVREFIASHPATRIKPEVDAALRAALLHELDDAKKVGTLAALQGFADANPGHGLDPELKDAIHGVYRTALEHYRARAPEKATTMAFVERLVAWAEAHGPKVEIRFRRLPSKTLARADASVARNANFMGAASFPSRYFSPGYEDRREARLARALAERFQGAFAPEILSFEVGAPVMDPEAPVEYRVPTILVDKKVEWPIGAEVRSKTPKGVYVSLNFIFEPAFRIPGEGKPLQTRTEVWRGPPLDILKDEEKDIAPGHSPAGSPEEKVYEAMAKDAYDVFVKRYTGLFFKH